MGTVTAIEAGPIAPDYAIAHRTEGRVRIVLQQGAARRADEFAASLALHPATTEVRWVPAARSITVKHDPGVPAEDILTGATRPRPPAVMLERRPGQLPGRQLLAMLPRAGGPGLLFDLALRVLAPPASLVLRRV